MNLQIGAYISYEEVEDIVCIVMMHVGSRCYKDMSL